MLHGEAVAGDQVKSHKFQHSVSHFCRVQLSDAPGSQATWMGIGLIQLAVELLEVGPADHAFAAHLQRLRVRDGHGYIEHDSDCVCHILTDAPFSTAGNGLLQLTVLVSEDKSQTIQLPRNKRRVAADKADDLVHRLGLGGGEHGAGVLDLRKAIQYFTGNLLRRRAG